MVVQHPHNVILEHAYNTKKKVLLSSSSLSSWPHPHLTPLSALGITNLLFICIFWTFHVNRVIQFVVFSDLLPSNFFKSSPKDMFLWILEREEGRERGKERNIDVREKHQSVASHMLPKQESNQHPTHAPCSRNELANFWCTGRRSSQLSHPPGLAPFI